VDTNEHVSILELQHPVADLNDAFFCWQTLSEGSRGKKGLYHANIDPAEQYELTPEQRLRAVDVLEEKLGFQGQSRAVVMHVKHGRAHLHVVWCRMDYDTATLRSDSQNYLKHEQASMQLEREFGHEIVPGKHAKRDREKQPEFPRQDHDFVEAQMAERSPMTVEDRKEQIRALHAAAANGQAFKKALEEAGYILAQGDRGYLVVDQAGVHSALSRNLQGVKKAQVDAFMADVPLDRLPTIEEAKALQEAKALSAQQPGAPAAAPAKPADMSLDERKAQITGIRKTCDDAQAFRNALEEAGYVLARGDKRGYVLVDEQGEIYSLSKHLTDIKGKEYKAFMAPIDMAALPDVEQAKALHAERAVKAEKPPQETSKFLTPELAQKLEQGTHAPEKAAEKPRSEDPRAPAQVPPAARPIDLTAYAPKEAPSKFLPPEMSAKVETPKPAETTSETQAPAAEQKLAEPVKKKGYDYAAYAPPELPPVLAPPAAPIEKRRAPLPSDPWMAQTGGVDNLSPAHLESAQHSYENWANKSRYDFANYVAYVQRQWENKELPPPPSHAEAPATLPQPAEPGKKKGYDYGAYSPRGPVTVPAPPPPPAPPQPKVPDLAEGPKPTWIKERAPHVPITPKQPGVNFDTYAPKAPEPVAPAAPDVRDQKLKEEFQKPAAPLPPKPEPTIDPEIEVIRQSIFKRQQRENREFIKTAAEAEKAKALLIDQKVKEIAAANVDIDKMEAFDFRQQEALQAELQRHAPRKGVREALRKFFKPEDEEAKAAERQEELDLFRSQQAHDRRAYIKSLEESRDDVLNRMRDELKALRDQHQAEQRDRNKGYDEELARRLRERQKAIDLAREQSGWAKDFEKEQEQRWDDPDVPRRGK